METLGEIPMQKMKLSFSLEDVVLQICSTFLIVQKPRFLDAHVKGHGINSQI